MKNISKKTYCGYVAIVGRPNVGKSTLLNRILGQKISITARKPQTTRHRILGIKTESDTQVIYVDTPGIHQQTKAAINRYMNRAAARVIRDVDMIIYMVEALKWLADDEWILKQLTKIKTPILLVVNKVDKVSDKKQLLPYINQLTGKLNFQAVIPLSAKKDTNLQQLENIINKLLPENPFYFSADQITDRDERFFAAEILREKLTRFLGEELPYNLSVTIEQFQRQRGVLRIAAVIFVEKPGQKAIIIGEQGQRLKEIGRKARIDMENFFANKVFLQTWVKVKRGWSDNEQQLRKLGYHE